MLNSNNKKYFLGVCIYNVKLHFVVNSDEENMISLQQWKLKNEQTPTACSKKLIV